MHAHEILLETSAAPLLALPLLARDRLESRQVPHAFNGILKLPVLLQLLPLQCSRVNPGAVIGNVEGPVVLVPAAVLDVLVGRHPPLLYVLYALQTRLGPAQLKAWYFLDDDIQHCVLHRARAPHLALPPLVNLDERSHLPAQHLAVLRKRRLAAHYKSSLVVPLLRHHGSVRNVAALYGALNQRARLRQRGQGVNGRQRYLPSFAALAVVVVRRVEGAAARQRW